MAIAELVMPKLGESIMEATILKWHKQVGDPIQQDETVLDIATDKVDSEVPSTIAGTLVEILFNTNDVVPIGAVIAKIQTDKADTHLSTVVNTTAIETIASHLTNTIPAEKEVTQTTNQESSSVDVLKTTEVPYLPLKEENANTHSLSTIFENRFYSPLVLNIANQEGISMQELERIPGTGHEGRVSKKDIIAYLNHRNSNSVPAFVVPKTSAEELSPVQIKPLQIDLPSVDSEFSPLISSGKLADPSKVSISGVVEIVEMDRMRKLIAKHMVNSVQTSPHVTSFAEADVTHMVLWRNKVKAEFEKREGTKLTFTPMFIECLANVMKRYPLINCSLEGDNILIKKDLNIGMATALPTGNLIVPVIKCADQLNIVGLSKAVNQLADAARNNKLKPEDTQGGSFTLTNVGTFGSLMGTPIINQPQVAILAVGAIKKRAVVIETPEGDTIGIRHMMYLSLSYDHRIVDGSIGAAFLSELAKEFEKWDLNKHWYTYL